MGDHGRWQPRQAHETVTGGDRGAETTKLGVETQAETTGLERLRWRPQDRWTSRRDTIVLGGAGVRDHNW